MSHRYRRTAGALTAAVVGATTFVALVPANPASAAMSDVTGQIGAGPCGTSAINYSGFYAPGTGQHNSCAAPGTNAGQTHAWCADFAGWSWLKNGGTVDGDLNDLASSFYDYGTGHQTWSSTPHVGDAVYFDSTIKGGYGHVAIVTAVNSDGTFTEVGGNEHDVVGPGNRFKPAPGSQVVWQDYETDGSGNYVYYTGADGKKYHVEVNVYVQGFASPVGATTSTTPAAVTAVGTWNGTATSWNSSQNASGTITLTATETHASRVLYYLNDTNPAANGFAGVISGSDSGGGASPSHGLAFSTAGLVNGQSYTITAAAFDATNTGQVDSTKTMTITINNAPSTPTVNVPASHAIGVITLSATGLSSNTTSVAYQIDGKTVGTATGGEGFALPYDSTNLADGLHTVTAVASNGATSSATSAGVQMKVFNKAAAPTIVAPGDVIASYRIQSDGNVWGSNQYVTGGTYTPWAQMTTGGGYVGDPQVIETSGGLLSIYARRTDGTVWGTSQHTVAGAFDPWVNINGGGGAITSDPTVVVTSSGLVALYVTASDGNVWGANQYVAGGTYTPWTQMTTGGGYVGKPAVIQSGGKLTLYVRRTDGTVWGTSQNSVAGAFDPWVNINGGGGAITGDPTALFLNDGRVAVYVTASDGQLWGTNQYVVGGNYTPWGQVTTGLQLTGRPQIVQTGAGLLAAYVRTTGGDIWGGSQQTAAGPFTGWGDVNSGGVDFTSDPTALYLKTGIIAIFGVAGNGNTFGTNQYVVSGNFTPWGQV